MKCADKNKAQMKRPRTSIASPGQSFRLRQTGQIPGGGKVKKAKALGPAQATCSMQADLSFTAPSAAASAESLPVLFALFAPNSPDSQAGACSNGGRLAISLAF